MYVSNGINTMVTYSEEATQALDKVIMPGSNEQHPIPNRTTYWQG